MVISRIAVRRARQFIAFAAFVSIGLALGTHVFIAQARAQDSPKASGSPAAVASSGDKPDDRHGKGGASSSKPDTERHRLPPDSTTKQTLALPGRTLAFAATAGSIRLFSGDGEPQADIAYTAYQLDGADPANRPVTFVFNGGPGAASAYLQFGNAGPWRLPIDGDAATSSAPPDLQPNADTWLDFTDLRSGVHRSRRHRL